MTSQAQNRATKNYRKRMATRGIARFEVQAPDGDRELIRALARKLVEEGPEAARTRAAMRKAVAGGPPGKGGILAALRRSPLVGADLDLSRSREEGRKVDL